MSVRSEMPGARHLGSISPGFVAYCGLAGPAARKAMAANTAPLRQEGRTVAGTPNAARTYTVVGPASVAPRPLFSGRFPAVAGHAQGDQVLGRFGAALG